MKSEIKIISAEYVEGYKIRITFSDGRVNIFDYEGLVMRNHEESLPYRDIENFKKFSIVSGCEIAWGDNWAMILPLKTIYNKAGFSNSGRKKLSDKKMLLPVYIRQSVIASHGGVEKTVKKVTEFLNSEENI